jgi:hypothetical protein
MLAAAGGERERYMGLGWYISLDIFSKNVTSTVQLRELCSQFPKFIAFVFRWIQSVLKGCKIRVL